MGGGGLACEQHKQWYQQHCSVLATENDLGPTRWESLFHCTHIRQTKSISIDRANSTWSFSTEPYDQVHVRCSTEVQLQEKSITTCRSRKKINTPTPSAMMESACERAPYLVLRHFRGVQLGLLLVMAGSPPLAPLWCLGECC